MSRVFVVLALVACAAFAVTNTTMPSYYAVGESAYELGRSIGIQQKEAFQELIKADDSLLKILVPWMEAHMDQYNQFCEANKKAYPDIFEEVRGIAAGAEIEENYTILLMLRPEIEALNKSGYSDNCFDIINNPSVGDENDVAFIAHNEDWTPAYKPFGFVLHEEMPFSTTGAQHIVAFTYPASPVGFTFGYNDYGVVTSCNGLNPIPCRPGKLGRYFINRDVLAATSMDDAIDRLKKAAPESALGFGMSIGMVGMHKMYHVEMAPYNPNDPNSKDGYVDVIEIKKGDSYLHSNSYTHSFFSRINQYTSNSTQHRLKRAGEMPTPKTPKLACDILGDTTDPKYPIYRHGDPNDKEELATISTAVLNLDNATITIYGGNPTEFKPVVVMPLFRPRESWLLGPFGIPFLVAAGFACVLSVFMCSMCCCMCCCCERKKKGYTYHTVNPGDGYSRVA